MVWVVEEDTHALVFLSWLDHLPLIQLMQTSAGILINFYCIIFSTSTFSTSSSHSFLPHLGAFACNIDLDLVLLLIYNK